MINEFIEYCMKNDVNKVKEMLSSNTIDINKIKYDINIEDFHRDEGPYSLFECMCIKNHIEIIKIFIDKCKEISIDDYNNGFITACEYNNIDIVKLLYENKNSINLDYQTSFIICCHEGHLELLKWLHNNSKNKIDIHFDNETPFLYSCISGNLDIAKWIYQISVTDKKIIDIQTYNSAFTSACYNGQLDICQWLYTISNNMIDIHMNNDAPIKNAKLSNNQDLIIWLENFIKH